MYSLFTAAAVVEELRLLMVAEAVEAADKITGLHIAAVTLCMAAGVAGVEMALELRKVLEELLYSEELVALVIQPQLRLQEERSPVAEVVDRKRPTRARVEMGNVKLQCGN